MKKILYSMIIFLSIVSVIVVPESPTPPTQFTLSHGMNH